MKKEINKKILFLSLVLASVILISLVGVYAADAPATTGNNLDNSARWISQQISSINIAGWHWNDPDTATPILLGILLFIVLYSILTKTGMFARSTGELGIGAAIVALIVTLLAFNFTPVGFWKVIVEEYRALGAAVLTLIPFLIMFYFTTAVSTSLLMTTFFWVVYVIYYFGALLYAIANSTGGIMTGETLPYWIAIVVGVALIFLIKPIRNWWFKEELVSQKETGMRKIQKAKAGADILGSAADTFSRK